MVSLIPTGCVCVCVYARLNSIFFRVRNMWKNYKEMIESQDIVAFLRDRNRDAVWPSREGTLVII